MGFWIAGQIANHYLSQGAHDWSAIWLYPAGFAMAVFLLFAVMFRNERAGNDISAAARQ